MPFGQLRVLVLTKRHVGSGNEIDVASKEQTGKNHATLTSPLIAVLTRKIRVAWSDKIMIKKGSMRLTFLISSFIFAFDLSQRVWKNLCKMKTTR